MTEHVGLYPGTFDPVTNGHLDIIARGARLVDRLVVGVAISIGKEPLFEMQMAGMNHRLDPGIETVFLMAGETNQFIASRLVKEIAKMGGDIAGFVPPLTLERTLARVR